RAAATRALGSGSLSPSDWSSCTAAPSGWRASSEKGALSGSRSRGPSREARDGDDRGGGGPARQPQVDHGAADAERAPRDRVAVGGAAGGDAARGAARPRARAA